MAILWCGGEEIDFKVFPSVFSTGNYYRRNTYARCAVSGGNVVSNTLFALSTPFQGGAVSNLGFSCMFTVIGAAVNNRLIGVTKESVGNGAGLYLGFSAFSSPLAKLAVYTFDGSSTWTKLAEEVGSSAINNIGYATRVDCIISNLDNVSTGNVKVYYGSILVIDYTGNLQAGTVTSVDQLAISACNNCSFSEIMVSDDDPRYYLGLFTIAPSAAGASTFTSGAYTDIDETYLDDTDMLISASAAQAFNCALTDLTASINCNIAAVKVVARAAKGASGGPTTLALGIKGGSTISTANNSLSTTYASYERYMSTNPTNSNNPFTPSDVNGLLLELDSVA